jgi:hypothetical protein
MILSGARVYSRWRTTACSSAARATLNPRTHAPVLRARIQCVWTVLLTLSGQYNDLLDYVIFAVLLFYILTIAGLFRLRRTRPDLERPTAPWATRSCRPCTSLSPVIEDSVAGEQTRVHRARADTRIAGGSRVLPLARKEGSTT